eukprot:g2341.t1
MKILALLATITLTAALHAHNNSASWPGGGCVSPGTCTPPKAQYSAQAKGPKPGQQWNLSGGFCGGWSTQQSALSVGAWVSQDLVRRSNRAQTGIEKNMHGDTTLGYEVVPVNVEYTAQQLKLAYDMWDYTQPAPQAAAYKKWLKSHLVKGRSIVWFPICKGDEHQCYEGSCPNGGEIDHVEPMFGIFSNHSLDDAEVYDDDVILHASDQDKEPYYRAMSTLEDDLSMEGNCANAGAGFGKNEMYPCFDKKVTYGLAVTGLAVTGTLPVSLEVDLGYSQAEPNVREGARAKQLTGTVTVTGLAAGQSYTIYRYDTPAETVPVKVPSAAPFDASNAVKQFTADSDSFSWTDTSGFASDGATYYLATKSS